ncbi:MAG: hypothetical protein RL417_1780 [Pseudomonadota bacterium]|jgi:dTDP-4-dehydrorhamnose reductase
MRILLFGGSGQLGYEIEKRAYDLNFEIVSPVISEVNIADLDQVVFLARKFKPELILNSAAYTAVDKAEEQRVEAFQVNRDGAAHTAEAAKAVGARLIHISTDYVFAGDGDTPLSEEAPVGPKNVYGASKLAGEEAVLDILGERALVVRTSSLHGQRGENFVHTMLKLFSERSVVRVVDDQFMSPTWAGWLAEALLDLAKLGAHGIFHASCAGAISWYDFAAEIQALADPHLSDGSVCRLERTTVAEFPRPAPRPRYSVMDCSKLSKTLGRRPISWREGLQAHLRDIQRLKPQMMTQEGAR